MMTFLELYQTLLGFVFYKLYTDINLVYPPKLDQVLDENGAGIGALLLEESGKGLVVQRDETEEDKEKKRVYAKDVRKQIREIGLGGNDAAAAVAAAEDEAMASTPSAAADTGDAALELDVFPTTDGDDSLQPEAVHSSTSLFSGYYFYLSREVTRPTLEFVIRSFGGQVGWDSVLGAGSPYEENDARITHHIVDRPAVAGQTRTHPGKRAYVQPQWVVDCINQKKLLPTGDYEPGQILPPHLSPFVDEDEVRARGGYVPLEAKRILDAGMEEVDQDDDDDDDEDDDEEEDFDDEEELEDDEDVSMAKNVRPSVGTGKKGKKATAAAPALLAAAKNPTNEALLHAAELEAEARGVAPAQFSAELASETKKAKKLAAANEQANGSKKKASSAGTKHATTRSQEEQLASIMLTGKQKKLYNKMSYSAERKKEEVSLSESRSCGGASWRSTGADSLMTLYRLPSWRSDEKRLPSRRARARARLACRPGACDSSGSFCFLFHQSLAFTQSCHGFLSLSALVLLMSTSRLPRSQ